AHGGDRVRVAAARLQRARHGIGQEAGGELDGAVDRRLLPVLGRHGPGVGGRESEGGCKYENGRGGAAERTAQQGTDSGRGECAATTLSTPRPGTPRKKTDALGAPGSRLSVLDVLQRGAERRVSLVHPVELLDVLRRERDPERAEVLPQMLPLVGL